MQNAKSLVQVVFAVFATGFALGVFGANAWTTHKALNQQKELALQTRQLTEEAHAKDVEYQKTYTNMRRKYSDLDAELNRLRVENAALRRSQRPASASVCDRELRKRDDLLLRMADLGIRTSGALEQKHAALKSCVGNYGSIENR